MKILYALLVLLLIVSCKKEKERVVVNTQSVVFVEKKSQKLFDEELKKWLIKDVYEDTIPGISLLKAQRELLHKKNGDPVVVAVIDMPLDINHEKLQDHIWVNKSEIKGNKKDDDDNGFVDDIHGWNFIGNSKGENIVFMNYEYTRILKSKREEFTKGETNLNLSNQYDRAEKAYEKRMEYAKKSFENAKKSHDFYYEIKNTLLPFFKDKETSVQRLDSILKANSKNEKLVTAIETYKVFLDENIDDVYIDELKLMAEKRLKILLNIEYDDRKLLKDNSNDITDKNYGNNMVDHNLNLMNHATLMAGIIVSTFNEKDIEDVMNRIMIMPLCVSGFGDEHDKDIALAIRYAVDNGADIINISSGKSFSLHENWVHDAIKYADSKNVLIVTSSGNDGYDLDSKENFRYPNDNDPNSNSEISNNYIRVGSSNYILDSTLVNVATNYGKTEVDIFAPGEEIFTTSAKKEKYAFTSGTSAAAAVVSKTAAILKSYYPQLTAPELKEIILETGIEYNIPVKMKDSLDKNVSIPFNRLSRSGKIVNLYNALQLAETLTQNNKN